MRDRPRRITRRLLYETAWFVIRSADTAMEIAGRLECWWAVDVALRISTVAGIYVIWAETGEWPPF